MTFIAVLWTIGGALSFEVAGITITIPGFLVIAAVLYAMFASGAMVLIFCLARSDQPGKAISLQLQP